jgi:hypothetical protein
MTHTGCHTPPVQSNTCSISEPSLNPAPRSPTAAPLAVRMLLELLLDLMLLMVLRPMPLASRVMLLWDPMLWDPMLWDPMLWDPMLWDLMLQVSRVTLPLAPMLQVSTVMSLRPVALGCVRVRSRCCSNN